MHNWLFICFLLSLPILLIVGFILWRIFRHRTQNGNVLADNEDIDDEDEGDEDENKKHHKESQNDQALSSSNQPPEKIPRKGTLRKNKTGSTFVDESALQDNFLSEFDKREVKRKALQEINDEKLRELLNWKSPYEFYDGPEKKIKILYIV